MNKIEYGHLWKFIVSVGVALIISSFLYPYLLVKEDFKSDITEEMILTLSDRSLERRSIQLDTSIFLLMLAPWASAFLFSTGIFLSIFGLIKWWKKQSKQDEKEIAELDKLRLEIKSMSPAEIIEKAIRETENGDLGSDRSKSMALYYKVEERIYYMLRTKYSINEVFYNRKVIMNNIQREIDILVKRENPKDIDIIVEVKYSMRPYVRSQIKDIIDGLKSIYTEYISIKENTLTYLFVVQPETILNAEYQKSLEEKIVNVRDEVQLPLRFTIIPLEEINKLEYKDFNKYWNL